MSLLVWFWRLLYMVARMATLQPRRRRPVVPPSVPAQVEQPMNIEHTNDHDHHHDCCEDFRVPEIEGSVLIACHKAELSQKFSLPPNQEKAVPGLTLNVPNPPVGDTLAVDFQCTCSAIGEGFGSVAFQLRSNGQPVTRWAEQDNVSANLDAGMGLSTCFEVAKQGPVKIELWMRSKTVAMEVDPGDDELGQIRALQFRPLAGMLWEYIRHLKFTGKKVIVKKREICVSVCEPDTSTPTET